MSFEELIKGLEQKANAEQGAILNAAKAEAKRIKSEASQESKRIIDAAKAEGERIGNEQKLEIKANTALRQKRIAAEAREELLKRALQGTGAMLGEFTKTGQYPSVLQKLARECIVALGKDAKLYCRKADEKQLKTAGFNICGNVDITGGVVAFSSDGKIKVNNSLEALFELHADKLRQIAFKELAIQPPANQQSKPAGKQAAKVNKKKRKK